MNRELLKQIGLELRTARRAAKIPLSKIAKILKIRKYYLTAIEKGNSDNLKYDTYTIGYIKIYAEFLNLDPIKYLTLIKNRSESNLPPITSENLITGKEFLPSRLMLIVCAALLMLVYFFYN